MIREAKINIPKRLFYINMFNENAVEKDIFDDKLSKRPFVGKKKKKHNTDNDDSLDNRAKSVGIAKLGTYV